MDLKKKMTAGYIGHIPGMPFCAMRDATIIDVEVPYVKISARPAHGKKYYEFWIEAFKVEKCFDKPEEETSMRSLLSR